MWEKKKGLEKKSPDQVVIEPNSLKTDNTGSCENHVPPVQPLPTPNLPKSSKSPPKRLSPPTATRETPKNFLFPVTHPFFSFNTGAVNSGLFFTSN